MKHIKSWSESIGYLCVVIGFVFVEWVDEKLAGVLL